MLPPGSRFARYTILRLIGAGGMGAVYEATQESPRRSVALKVIRGSWPGEQLLRRFEHESEVLGRLQHPGIAQVFEAGFVSDGPGGSDARAIPFFAMELIHGVPLTDYAASRRPGTRERLDLMARISDAVYHAHQKGVIHRDLKPGNILVDESGQPKVLDFGVARATDSDLQQTTMQTDIGQLIGTVPYMSPEQAGGDSRDLDTRSDVYALGVIAYELLAGKLPYDLQKKMIHEAVRVIREEDPVRLSSINRTLGGDIETIVAKALEKDKARRYPSAEALGTDIRRYLKDEPINARPASTWYQTVKFARRNKALVGGLGATFVALIVGVVGVSLMLQRALAAESGLTRQVGETNAALTKAQHAEAETKKRADELQQVSDFQEKMLAQIDPTTAGAWLTEDVTKRLDASLEKLGVPAEERQAQVDAFRKQWVRVNATDAATTLIDRAILQPAVKAIDGQFKDQPVIDARLRQALEGVYSAIGLYESAFPLLESALATRRRVLGEEHPDTLNSINNMGILLSAQGRLAEAEPYFREVLEKRRRVLGDEHQHTLFSINNLGLLLRDQGRLTESEPYLSDAMKNFRRVLGEEHISTIASINNMATLLASQGRLAESEPYFREAMEKVRRVRGQEHPFTLYAANNLGVLLTDLGRFAEAEVYLREAMEKRRRVLGEEHPDTVVSIYNLARLLADQDKLAEAEPYFREAVDKGRRVLGQEHPDTLLFIHGLGSLLRDRGNLVEAEQHLREAMEKFRRVLGDAHPSTLLSLDNLGRLLVIQGKFGEAELCLGEAMEKRSSTLGESNQDTLRSIRGLEDLYSAWDKVEPGKGYDSKAMEWRTKLESAKRAVPSDSDAAATNGVRVEPK